MIEYAHEEKFFQHTSVDLLIVDSGATVTAVSGDAPQVTGATIQITNEMLLKESFSLKESLCSEENLKFGTMEASYCNFTFIGADVPSLEEEEIIIYLYFDGDSSTLFPIGRYIVESDEWTSTSGTLSPRQVSAYDVLAMLEDYDITEWYNEAFSEDTTVSVKDLRDSLFEWLAEEEPDYYIEQAETTLTNDDFMVEKSIESDVITFGFFMRGLMEINGVFGHIDRNGNFKYVLLETYDMPAKSIILNDKRIPPTDYADITVWGIGYVAVYDQDNIRIAKEGSSSKKHPNVYTVVDNFAFSNLNSTAARLENIKAAVQNMRDAVYHRRYRPYKMQTAGDLCIEVGDRIDIQYSLDDEDNPKTYYTYVLQRSFKGIQSFRDTFEAKGERKQPKYKISNDRWHVGDSQSGSADGTGGIGTVNDTSATDLIRYWRNIGIRLLQEPDNVSVVYNKAAGEVQIMWTDPSDINTYAPVPVDWAGTIVVRKEGGIPYHRWDGTVLVNSTTRDEYSEEPFIDDTVEENKKYYYGIFPYHIHLDDADHPIRYYRFTKVVSVNTQSVLLAPLITSHMVEGTSVTISFSIPELASGSYSYIKVVAKKGSIPTSKTDGIVKDVTASDTSVIFNGLDSQSKYYFMIFANDGATEAESDPDDCVTGIENIIMEYGNASLAFKIAITRDGGIVPYAFISNDGIVYGGVSYSKSAYYIDTEDVTNSEICVIGNNGLLSQMRKTDSSITTTYNPVANNGSEYLYKSKIVSDKFNISKPAIPVFLRSADYNSFITGGNVIRSVYSEFLNKHFSHPNDVPSWWEECPDGKAYYEYTVPSSKTMTAMLITIGANTAEVQQKDFYVEFRRTRDGEAFKTEHLYFQSPYGSPCDQFFIDDLSLTGTMWIVVYDNRTSGWLPSWRDVFIELE